MRVVQLNPYHYPYMGGIEHRIHEVSKRLSSKHEMIVLTGQLPGYRGGGGKMDGYRWSAYRPAWWTSTIRRSSPPPACWRPWRSWSRTWSTSIIAGRPPIPRP